MNTSIITGDQELRGNSPVHINVIEEHMQTQIDMGPRIPGSEESLLFKEWILEQSDDIWEINMQNFTHLDVELRNYYITIIDSELPEILIGAHYDSRAVADRDPNPILKDNPVPGANDGASGVAAILEMMALLPEELSDKVGFILFDGEDQGSGGMENWDWIVGSDYFAGNMSEEQVNNTQVFILFDMIADDELQLPYEMNSNRTYIDEIWNTGIDLGYDDIFLLEGGPNLIDDHIPFKRLGIPSVDIIDFTYPEWHTTNDDMDHIDPVSVAIVVDTVLIWLANRYGITLSEGIQSTTEHTAIHLESYMLSLMLLGVTRKVFKRSKCQP
jgi:hypothetical protein